MYSSILEQFFHTEKITEYSLDKIRDACEYFGNPQNTFKSIHIAGTNGKGSVSKMIFQILKKAGKRVGVFTSPHLIDIRERWEMANCTKKEQDFSAPLSLRSKGQELGSGLISEDDFARIAEQIIDYGHGLSYFEKCVLLAFLYFREQGCEYAVIEVGLGGRLDATNIITPILSIITSISYDHMEYLGDTLEKIAMEKGGIIKQGVPLILYDHNPTIEKIAQEKDSLVFFPRNRETCTNLPGIHQISNARIAYEAGIFLGISEEIIQSALLDVDHHGRLEYIRPNLLIDGAHNEDGMRKLKEYLESIPQKEIVYCFNLKNGKPASLVLDIFPHVENWIVVDTASSLVNNAGVMTQDIHSASRNAMIAPPSWILEESGKHPEKLFVVFGSLYMIGEFLNR